LHKAGSNAINKRPAILFNTFRIRLVCQPHPFFFTQRTFFVTGIGFFHADKPAETMGKDNMKLRAVYPLIKNRLECHLTGSHGRRMENAMDGKMTGRRCLKDRRAGIDRRRICLLADTAVERRDGTDRRSGVERRRSGKDRRKKNPWSRPAQDNDSIP
jgi:hypothetical protein